MGQQCTVVPRAVPETICNPKPVTECTTVNRQVPETNCVDKPVTECVNVPKSVPVQEQVARKVCRNQSFLKHVRHGLYSRKGYAASTSHHGKSSGTRYAYGNGGSFTRRDY